MNPQDIANQRLESLKKNQTFEMLTNRQRGLTSVDQQFPQPIKPGEGFGVRRSDAPTMERAQQIRVLPGGGHAGLGTQLLMGFGDALFTAPDIALSTAYKAADTSMFLLSQGLRGNLGANSPQRAEVIREGNDRLSRERRFFRFWADEPAAGFQIYDDEESWLEKTMKDIGLMTAVGTDIGLTVLSPISGQSKALMALALKKAPGFLSRQGAKRAAMIGAMASTSAAENVLSEAMYSQYTGEEFRPVQAAAFGTGARFALFSAGGGLRGFRKASGKNSPVDAMIRDVEFGVDNIHALRTMREAGIDPKNIKKTQKQLKELRAKKNKLVDDNIELTKKIQERTDNFYKNRVESVQKRVNKLKQDSPKIVKRLTERVEKRVNSATKRSPSAITKKAVRVAQLSPKNRRLVQDIVDLAPEIRVSDDLDYNSVMRAGDELVEYGNTVNQLAEDLSRSRKGIVDLNEIRAVADRYIKSGQDLINSADARANEIPRRMGKLLKEQNEGLNSRTSKRIEADKQRIADTKRQYLELEKQMRDLATSKEYLQATETAKEVGGMKAFLENFEKHYGSIVEASFDKTMGMLNPVKAFLAYRTPMRVIDMLERGTGINILSNRLAETTDIVGSYRVHLQNVLERFAVLAEAAGLSKRGWFFRNGRPNEAVRQLNNEVTNTLRGVEGARDFSSYTPEQQRYMEEVRSFFDDILDIQNEARAQRRVAQGWDINDPNLPRDLKPIPKRKNYIPSRAESEEMFAALLLGKKVDDVAPEGYIRTTSTMNAEVRTADNLSDVNSLNDVIRIYSQYSLRDIYGNQVADIWNPVVKHFHKKGATDKSAMALSNYFKDMVEVGFQGRQTWLDQKLNEILASPLDNITSKVFKNNDIYALDATKDPSFLATSLLGMFSRGISRGMLYFNANTMANQFSALSLIFAKSDVQDFVSGTVAAVNPATRAFIRKNSKAIQARNLEKPIEVGGGLTPKFDKLGVWGMNAADDIVSNIAWYAGYRRAKRAGATDTQAIRAGDSHLNRTNVAYDAVFRAPMARGKVGGAFFQFQTYGINLWESLTTDMVTKYKNEGLAAAGKDFAKYLVAMEVMNATFQAAGLPEPLTMNPLRLNPVASTVGGVFGVRSANPFGPPPLMGVMKHFLEVAGGVANLNPSFERELAPSTLARTYGPIGLKGFNQFRKSFEALYTIGKGKLKIGNQTVYIDPNIPAPAVIRAVFFGRGSIDEISDVYRERSEKFDTTFWQRPMQTVLGGGD